MNFYNQNILYTEQFNRDSIEKVLDTAQEMTDIAFNKEKSDLLKGKVLASLFYEASTRTRLSFETAMIRLGGDVLSVPDIETSSLAKGESLADTAKTIEQFVDVMAVRHPRNGSAEEMAVNCKPPVINAGDGPNQHPTQALLDMYTIRDEFGKIDGVKIAMVGDLKYGRTTHSLVNLLKNYDVKYVFVAPDALQMPDEYLEGIEYEKTDKLEEGLKDVDFVYMTRIQRERFDSVEEYEKYKGVYVLDKQTILDVNPDVKVLHPLPRIDEIALDVDDMKNACYFKQARNGVAVRMALLALVLGKA
jgi:aspartate carbamoyltransferase catalytic subunit